MTWILFFLFIWTVASTGMLIRNLGDKYKKGPNKYSIKWWWEEIFYAPTMVLAYIIGWLGSLGRK